MQKGIDYPAVAVVPIIHDGAGKYLVELRSQNCRDEKRTWNVAGGGGLEQGETLEAGLMREIKEEVGAMVLKAESLGFREVFRDQNGQTSHWIQFDFKVLVEPAEVENMEPDKIDELRWVTIDKIPEPMHSQFPAFLAKYKDVL